jgi:hypothetical protein
MRSPSRYKTVLKYDPDQKQVRRQRKMLKKVTEMLAGVEKLLSRGQNKKAVAELDAVFPALSGLDVDSSVFRSTILLKLCRARAAMGQHEEALENCEEACAVLLTPMPGQSIDRVRMMEAREARERSVA